jgi:hypothetical protein
MLLVLSYIHYWNSALCRVFLSDTRQKKIFAECRTRQRLAFGNFYARGKGDDARRNFYFILV